MIRRYSLLMSTALLDKVLGPKWCEKCSQIQNSSPFSKVKVWRHASFIMKASEDIWRETLVMQIINKLNYQFQQELLHEMMPYLWLYAIMCVADNVGLIECLVDTKSINDIKKQVDGFTTLRNYFKHVYCSLMQT